MKVLKFGGSSVADTERIKNVIEIIKKSINENNRVAVVFSAFHKVTDNLLRMSQLAASCNTEYLELYKKLEDRHISIAQEILAVKTQSKVLAHLKFMLNELEDVLHGVFLVKELSPRTQDFILSFGERLSSFIIANAIKDRNIDCEFLDSRPLVKTDESFGSAKVDFDTTFKNIKKYFNEHKKFQVVTGFIGSTINNETSTLGRGGSDYTAAIFGAALNVKEIEIWTDVDGVLTADPKKVKKAFPLKSLTYEEAMELSHFGAKVIHPPTMHPAMEKKIPIRIKNTFNPDFEGTLINGKSNSHNFSIKGISSIDDIALIRVQGGGMVGVAGIAQRIFSALAGKKINIILISQASSEHSLCFAVLPKFAPAAKKAIQQELYYEIKEKLIHEPIVETNFSIIAVVGENMRRTPGISGKIFQALGKNGVNIVAIAQGSSELNISTVISRDNEAKALNALHDAFFLSIVKTVNLFVVGTGLVGGTLLEQINNQTDFLSREYLLNIKLIGLANSRKMLIDPNSIGPEIWKDRLNQEGIKTNLDILIAEMKKLNLPNSVFVDCTASEKVSGQYKEILDASISVVTPNKRANAGSFKYYQELKHSALKHNVKFLYETNVGAGLPIINTLNDLVSSGDKVHKIEGVMSGTLSYIFSAFKEGKSFSQVVKEAKDKGYTEPDPREDLNGMDVARKLLILARETGLSLELKDIKVENLVPEPARKTKSVDEFFTKLAGFDKKFEEKRKRAADKGNVLRYVASLENGKAEISLQMVNSKHPFYSLSGSDNMFALYTTHYQEHPIVIKGPGAGADVTAAGVFADIIRISNYLS
ncbi:MAG: bifunctional aspartate kinase/homoserine dehydrogenase I [Ignavibacteriaceae bacterium]|nr:bifunctional aspartate kinase/homoserine dehydrogenase I [Ignavibacteriaceae bacterium]